MRAHILVAFLSALCSPVTPANFGSYREERLKFRSLTVLPVNAAVVAGKAAILPCSSDFSNSLTWLRSDGKGSRETVLVSGCRINPQYQHAIALEKVGPGHCDLIVKSAGAGDAGMYRCLESIGWDLRHSALLAVLDAEPECRIDNVDPRYNDNVTLTCDVSYTDNISPMVMTWTDEQGRVVPSSSGTNSLSAGRTRSSITFKVTSHAALPRYTCTTQFSAPVSLPSTATNTPTLSFTWTSPAVNVRAELKTPLNTAGVVGQAITLHCCRNTQQVVWTFIPSNDCGSPVAIVSGCEVVPGAEDRYRVDTVYEACHLVIDKINSAHAGTYTCQDVVSKEKPALAQLVVLNATPKCELNTVDHEASRETRLSCSISYTGKFTPVVKWTDETGTVLVHNTNTNRTQVEDRLNIAAVDKLRVITAKTYFEEPILESSSFVHSATNAPSYTCLWSSRLEPVPGLGDCAEIKKTYRFSESGIYFIQIPKIKGRTEVYCDMDTTGGGWTVFQRRMDGSVVFYRDWAAYREGFGRRDHEFWLGNDNLAALTSQKQYVLRLDLGDWANNRRWAEYNNFRVLGAADKYQLISVGTFSGNAGDSMTKRHINMKFSTYDQDNDICPDCSCATIFRGAWWYTVCHDSNLNGQYNNTAYGQGVNWREWLGHEYSLRFTEMKIRPVNF